MKFTHLFKGTTLAVMATLALTGCGNVTKNQNEDVIKIGMVTDAGSIEDKSFNQGTWEGIQKYANEHENVEIQYVQPEGESTQDYLLAIDNLVLSGNELIITPGFAFEEAIGLAQYEYPETSFLLIDGTPLYKGDYIIEDNVSSIFFTEHEAGFLSGVAAATQTKTGNLGFLGGMEVPAVQKYGWGFVAGVAYANANLGTNAKVVDYVYQGTFTDSDAGKSIAGGMYDKGIDIIQHAGGLLGTGAIAEAKERGNVFVVGVDVDQYEDGKTDNSNSVILTSAMKNLTIATYNEIDKYINGQFEGGNVKTLTIAEDAVGLPTSNPNLTEETLINVEKAKEAVLKGLKVPSSVEELEVFLNEYNYSVEGLNY